jgi:Icc-related predicted phosphoesterase
VTHHAPSPQSIPSSFQENAFNPAFASDMTRFINESTVKLWIHGHIHAHSDYRVGNTSNPGLWSGITEMFNVAAIRNQKHAC